MSKRFRSLMILAGSGFLGWFGGLVLMHVLELTGMRLTGDQENTCLMTGLLLGLMANAFSILWACIACAGNREACENCPRGGRWQRFCNNHRLCAVFLMFWAVGVAFILAHFMAAVFGLAILEVVDHAIKFLAWLLGGLLAIVAWLRHRLF
jgi:hypothetical protein